MQKKAPRTSKGQPLYEGPPKGTCEEEIDQDEEEEQQEEEDKESLQAPPVVEGVSKESK